LRRLTERERAILGLIIAPLVPTVLLTLPAALNGDPRAPAHFLLRKQQWTSLGAYAAVGAAMGLAVFLFELMVRVPSRLAGLGPGVARLLSLPVDVIGGVILLICFWLIARPDRE